ncbi:hypothetical protein XENTR_v10019581 [Xenopus tropicalis]|uniref:Free fatty acid receptor 2 n=3 Tax=Xenopus tropicalis TaxID=8364 RepID=A0A1B8Y6Z8_XENTR|nr:free fatty acid receptor 2 [Xenopus tropicalis]KAE8594328.1 hypothetical protein XENTR_v10019581 [Xenopus tropicalis]|eukprot:XP_017945128.1 PREDICTED: free fatty acid receptor 2-like [Xenopus tropicalis]
MAQVQGCLQLAVYIITFVFGLPLNILAFVTFLRKFKQKVISVDILLFNLTLSDLVLLAFLPFRIVEAASEMEWRMPYFICPFSLCVHFSSNYINSFLLTAISVERYLAVGFPLRYKRLVKPLYIIVGIVCIWILSTTHCSIFYIVDHFAPEKANKTNVSICYSQFSPVQLQVLLPIRLEVFFLLFCIPFMVTTFCSISFVHIMVTQPFISRKRKLRAIGLVTVTMINFILCFMPYNVSHVVGFIQGDNPPWRMHALLFSTFNATLDPIMFYFCSVSYQKMHLEDLLYIMNKTRLGAHRDNCLELFKKDHEEPHGLVQDCNGEKA